jgi:hypothetical protein
MITTIFDKYLETIAGAVDRVLTDDFGVICNNAEWNAGKIEKALHDNHQILNTFVNIGELDKELCDCDKEKLEHYVSKLAKYYIDRLYLAKDVFKTESIAIKRQLNEVDDCLKLIDADNNTKSEIKLSYESLLIKYATVINEFFDEMNEYNIRLRNDKPTKTEMLEKELTESMGYKFRLVIGIIQVQKIYDYLIESGSIPSLIKKDEFQKHIFNADFSREYESSTKKCNLLYTIQKLRENFSPKKADQSWFVEICESIGMDKNRVTSNNGSTTQFKNNFPH